MRKFDEYRKDFNEINLKNGYKIFKKKLSGLEGVSVKIDDVENKCVVINEENINSDKREFRTLCMEKDVKCKHGSYIEYNKEMYIVITDIDDHFYYKSCKIQKCKNVLQWKMEDILYKYPCILANDSYGVKILSDNDYTRNQNIKAQILVQNNENTKKIIQDMRFMFNKNKNDIYAVIDISSSMVNGILVLTSEKSVYQYNDDIENNLAFSKVLVDENIKDDTSKDTTYSIIGEDTFYQNKESEYYIEPFTKCKFYIDDFDLQYNVEIISNQNSKCILKGKDNMGDNYITLYAKKEDVVICQKKINIVR